MINFDIHSRVFLSFSVFFVKVITVITISVISDCITFTVLPNFKLRTFIGPGIMVTSLAWGFEKLDHRQIIIKPACASFEK